MDEILGRTDAADLAECQQAFDLRWKADMRAIKRWQDATGKKLVWPDHADLCVWLLERVDAAEKAMQEMIGVAGKADAEIERLRAALVAIDKAWATLPPGHYSPHEIQQWILGDMKGPILAARALLASEQSATEG